ncbi:MAG: hypothetical protein RL701_1112 [Pseudomonadota bacterium]|jgi:hypothetical protein
MLPFLYGAPAVATAAITPSGLRQGRERPSQKAYDDDATFMQT